MSEITMKELEEVCKKAYDKRTEIESLEDIISKLNAELEEYKNIIVEHLNLYEKSSYDSAMGRITIKNVVSVSSPKDPESKEQFFNYLKERGEFDDMISVNSKTLNSWYKQEQELALKEGRIDFSIPGLPEPYTKQTITFARKK